MLFFRRFLFLTTLILSTFAFASVGKVSLLKGEAFAFRGEQSIKLSNGMAIEEKDTIRTSKEAQIQLIFEDKTVITLGSESELNVETYFNDAQNSKAKFKFNQGTFKSITGQIGKTAPENFILETKTATIGIRGTTVMGKLAETGDTIGCTSGLISVSNLGSEHTILVPAGQMTFVSPTGVPTPPEAIKMDALRGDREGQGGPNNNGGKPERRDDGRLPPPPPLSVLDASHDDTQNTIITQTAQDLIAANPTQVTGYVPSTSITDNSDYPTDQILQGTLSEQASGTVALYNNLEVLLDKNTPSTTVSANPISPAIPLTIASTDSNFLSSYTHDDDFKTSSISSLGKQNYFNTTSFGYVADDYVSWGYWSNDYQAVQAFTSPLNTWVAGIKTPTATLDGLISGSANYSYTGKVIGNVTKNAQIGYILDNATNAISLSIAFGSSGVINGSIAFQTSLDSTVWNVGSFALTSFNNTGFTATLGNGNISGGTINGSYYGPNAETVAGGFTATKSSQETVVGSFKATKPIM